MIAGENSPAVNRCSTLRERVASGEANLFSLTYNVRHFFTKMSHFNAKVSFVSFDRLSKISYGLAAATCFVLAERLAKTFPVGRIYTRSHFAVEHLYSVVKGFPVRTI